MQLTDIGRLGSILIKTMNIAPPTACVNPMIPKILAIVTLPLAFFVYDAHKDNPWIVMPALIIIGAAK